MMFLFPCCISCPYKEIHQENMATVNLFAFLWQHISNGDLSNYHMHISISVFVGEVM